jgi:hypothetical protein
LTKWTSERTIGALMTRHLLIVLLPSCALAMAAACGGRNLEDLEPDVVYIDGSGGDGAGASVGGAGGVDPGPGSGAGGPGSGAGGPGSGAGGPGSGAGSPIDCFGCIGDNCPQAIGCVTDPTCIQGIACSVTQCLAGGQPDIECLTDCFDGDVGAALEAIDVLTCVFGQCQMECGGLLPLP